MNTVIYEKINHGYRVKELKEDNSDRFRFILDSPVNGRLMLDGEIITVRSGVADIAKSKLSDKAYVPTFFGGDGAKKTEGFYVKDGVIRVSDPDGEYVREISRRVELLSEKLMTLEEKIEEISDKIENTIIF